jgi:hypothetical protein
MITRDAFLSYPYHNQPFHIYCDASELQLGAGIIQNGRAVAFYSHKLTATQRLYTVGEKEMLLIVETLKEFCTCYTAVVNSTFTQTTKISSTVRSRINA